MTRQQTVIWTALPNGVSGVGDAATLRLAVLVSPRLWSDEGSRPTLETFPDFLNWPAVDIRFSVQFDDGPLIPAAVAGPSPSARLWSALFSDNTFVRPREFQSEILTRPVRSYPARHVGEFIKQCYTDLVDTSGDTLPSVTTLLSPEMFGPLAFFADVPGGITGFPFSRETEHDVRRDLENLLVDNRALAPGPPDPKRDLLQVRMFHERKDPRRPDADPQSLEPDPRPLPLAPPDIDFHQAINAIGEYPAIMRELGLLRDLEIPLTPDIPQGVTTVQVLAEWSPQEPNTINVPNAGSGSSRRMQTRCVVGPSQFTPVPRSSDPDIADGALRLEDGDNYVLLQIDQDGAAIKLFDFANSLVRSELALTADTPTNYSVPSLQSAGLSVARVGRAVRARESWSRQEGMNQVMESGGDLELAYEDLLRGWVVDVWDSHTNAWHSLCDRIGVYRFPDANITRADVRDEGSVSGSVTSRTDGVEPHLYLPETFIDYTGWSLAAPRPGAVLDENGNPVTLRNTAATEFNIEVDFRPTPGSLPLLRYGRRYRIRARAMDLGGNRIPLDASQLAGFAHATDEIVYGRFEPVPAPTIILRKSRTEAETPVRLVLRSNYNVAPTPAVNERHIVPPKIAATMAETHGMFDVEGVLNGDAYDQFLMPPPLGEIQPWEGGTIDDVGTVDVEDYGLPFVDADTLRLPYLPDIFSKGAVFEGLPGTSGLTQLTFNNSRSQWPSATPFRLVIDEGDGPPDVANDRIVVHLPKGDVVKVRVSSLMDPEDVEQMGLYQWLRESGRPTLPLVEAASKGRNWMVTPSRELTLVHAIRQPLVEPRIVEAFADRELGETVATIRGQLNTSRKSTDKIDFLAEWHDPIDALANPGPTTVRSMARPFDIPVPRSQEPGDEEIVHFPVRAKPSGTRHQFPDTNYHRVEYTVVGSTRFSEYFVERKKPASLAPGEQLVLDAAGVVEGSEAVRAANGDRAFQRGDEADYTMDYDSGTLTATASLADVPLNIAYVAKPISRTSAESYTVDVPNAARPAAPKVLYAIPAFTWATNEPNERTKVSTRLGGRLRVYLDRPWWSSGDGELLGVVLWHPVVANPGAVPPDELKPYVTQWGQDALYASRGAPGSPDLDAFPRSAAAQRAIGLSLAERSRVPFDVAGHSVAYDAQRQLWYCDIEVDLPNAYSPFVRLALARYQPNSLRDAHLSPVVRADFMSLPNDRFASVVRDPENPKLLTVTVVGQSYSRLRGISGPATIEVTVEHARPGLDPDVAGEVAWARVETTPSVFTLDSRLLADDGRAFWTGPVSLPNATGRYRLVIREWEVFEPARTSTGGPFPFFFPAQRRLVYADAIEV